MILGPKVGVLPSFVAKIIGNNYCTDTSVQPATVEVREFSIRVCKGARVNSVQDMVISSEFLSICIYTRLISCLNG